MMSLLGSSDSSSSPSEDLLSSYAGDMYNPESLTQVQNTGPELDSLNFDNMTSIDDVVEKLMDSDLLTFFFSLFCSIVWVVYITFYSSRITGLLVTKVVNRVFKDGYIKIGEITFEFELLR